MIAYFGCWKKSGHFYYGPGSDMTMSERYRQRMHLPKPEILDCSRLFLPRPEQRGIGALTHLPAPNFTVLAWWGSPWDARGKVNCTVIADGKRTLDNIWEYFKKEFSDPENLVKKPTIVMAGP
jgi:hypothetical protein